MRGLGFFGTAPRKGSAAPVSVPYVGSLRLGSKPKWISLQSRVLGRSRRPWVRKLSAVSVQLSCQHRGETGERRLKGIRNDLTLAAAAALLLSRSPPDPFVASFHLNRCLTLAKKHHLTSICCGVLVFLERVLLVITSRNRCQIVLRSWHFRVGCHRSKLYHKSQVYFMARRAIMAQHYASENTGIDY